MIIFTNILTISEAAEKLVRQSEGGTHADEIETSIMLYIAPESVDMSKAVKDYHPGAKNGLSRDPKTDATYSASGVFGDATLATRAKGRLQHACRTTLETPVDFSRKLAVRAVGENRTETVVSYIR